MRFAALLTLACFGSCLIAEVPDVTRPNIFLMMADDMGLGDTSAYQDFTGNSDDDQIHTPNMDRLSRRGVRFTDAHTPASRCTLTRYSLLTGRYSWRNRLKHWVLFGVQGDPLIEADRPTIATLLKRQGYATAIVGKWHVGLRYRQSNGKPADAWNDADLTQPMFDTPLDHGFDFCRFTSRSHGTSGPAVDGKRSNNSPTQTIGPGHIHGRTIIAATDNGKLLSEDRNLAYRLHELGGRHLRHAQQFVGDHLANDPDKPFFLYFASNSNHGPYTPDSKIGGIAVMGGSRNVAGETMNLRSDYIHENDVVLGQMLDYLQRTDDPRNPGAKLVDNTVVIFTSDNGAEKNSKTATGPFRSHKGSVYEGGHRVPFLVSWPAGNVGSGSENSMGRTDRTLLGLQDLYATLEEIVEATPADYSKGEKGGEDSHSVLAAWRGQPMNSRAMFFNDHKEADDHAVVAFRLDDPLVGGETVTGKWKLFFDSQLLRAGVANAVELYDLETDTTESRDRMGDPGMETLVEHLVRAAIDHRTAAGHRLVPLLSSQRFTLNWRTGATNSSAHSIDLREAFEQTEEPRVTIEFKDFVDSNLRATVRAVTRSGAPASRFDVNPRGLGVHGGEVKQVDDGESIVVEFNQDVLIESAAIVAGNGICGGSYRVGNGSPLAIYCVDADIDAKDQSGILSDIGVLPKGQKLRFDSRPHHGVETSGRWRVGAITLRPLKQ